MNRKEATSLLVSGLAITSGVLSAYLTGGITLIKPEILSEGLKALGGLGGNLVANSLQTKLIDKHPPEDLLKNGDLTRAIGRSIFALCGQLAGEISGKYDKKALENLAATDLEYWESLVIGGEYEEGYGLSLSTINLDEISAEKSVQYVHAQSDKLDEIKTLTPSIWQNIIVTLYKKEKYSLSSSVKEELANKLHKKFAQALRHILIDDFSKDGKAYASMQFRILGEILNYLNEILAYSKQNYELNDTILAIVVDLSKQVDKINQISPANYSTQNRPDWEIIINDFNAFRETLGKTYQNTVNILSIVQQILENQSKQASFKNLKPQGFINSSREKNDYFVEQGNIFERLDEKLKKHHLAYLHGIHGLGKTTTVIEYAYAREKNYGFIFYVLSADLTIEAEMAKLADKYVESVSVQDKPETKALKLKSWLEESSRWEPESMNWLIIFDNLESEKLIQKYFPTNGPGDVLYTCNEQLYTGNDRRVEFEQFTNEEAELFLYQKVNSRTDVAHKDIPADDLGDIRKVIAELGTIPLALNIAGSYLRETDVSYDDYVELIKANIKKHLKYKDEHSEYQKETAFDAFSVSLDKIKEFDPDDEDAKTVAMLAETILYLCSFCSPEDIPEELIEKTLFGSVELSETGTPPKILFREAVGLLRKFNLLKHHQKTFRYKHKLDNPQTLADGSTVHWEFRETESGFFDTYRTLQNVLFTKLTEEPKKLLIENILLILNSILPETQSAEFTNPVDFIDLEIYGKYSAPAFSIITAAEKLNIHNFFIVRISNNIGQYHLLVSQYQQSEFFFNQAKTVCESTFKDDEAAISTIYNNLATLYEIQGRIEKAEALFKDSVSLSERVNGNNHFNTATSYNNLARLFLNNSRFEEAEPLFIKVKDILELVAKNHPNMASTYNNLAMLYDNQRRYSEAETYHEKALKLTKELHGEFNPSTALSYANLGGHYHAQRHIEKAEFFYKKAIEIRERISSEFHPDAVITYDSLASIYINQEKYEAAKPLLQKAIEINQQIFHEHHPAAIYGQIILADIYFRQSKFEKATPIYKQLRSVFETNSSEDFTSIANIINRLAVACRFQELFDEAFELFEEELGIYRDKLGIAHPQTVESEFNLASLYFERGRYEKAKPLFERLRTLYEQSYGENHADMADFYNRLATIYKSLKEFDNAKIFFEKVMLIYEKEFGNTHVNTAILYNNLGDIYIEQKEYSLAEKFYRQTEKVYKKEYGESHSYTALIYHNLGKVYRMLGNYSASEKYHKKVSKINSEIYKEDNLNTAVSDATFGRLRFEQGKYEEALELTEKALKVMNGLLPKEHPHIQKINEWLDDIKKVMNNQN